MVKKLLFLCFVIVACSNDSSSLSKNESTVTQPSSEKIEGMRLIPASDLIIELGSNSSDAKAKERPVMKVKLDYDFYMGLHEVSCGEFDSVALVYDLPNLGSCEQDSFPKTNITFYDAILFCNAYSKLNNYDTVYSYTKLSFDKNNHCIFMEGLVFHENIKGFRLPTEAEWMRAALIDYQLDYSWNADNSDYKIHKICSKLVDSAGFCDFSGNVKEWVYDYFGYFKDTLVTNYCGSVDGGDVSERIIKGGSFNEDKAHIKSYARGDVYTVTSQTNSDYLGMRIALGVIPNPIYLNENGSFCSKILIKASLETLK